MIAAYIAATPSALGRAMTRATFAGSSGGACARCARAHEAEPEIYAATERFGSVMENVALDPLTRVPDFDDDSKTENTRVAYPLDFIPTAS